MKTGWTSCLASHRGTPHSYLLTQHQDLVSNLTDWPTHSPILRLLCPPVTIEAQLSQSPGADRAAPRTRDPEQPLPIPHPDPKETCWASRYTDAMVLLLFWDTHTLENLRKGLDGLSSKCIHTHTHTPTYIYTYICVWGCIYIHTQNYSHNFCMFTHSLKPIHEVQVKNSCF